MRVMGGKTLFYYCNNIRKGRRIGWRVEGWSFSLHFPSFTFLRRFGRSLAGSAKSFRPERDQHEEHRRDVNADQGFREHTAANRSPTASSAPPMPSGTAMRIMAGVAQLSYCAASTKKANATHSNAGRYGNQGVWLRSVVKLRIIDQREIRFFLKNISIFRCKNQISKMYRTISVIRLFSHSSQQVKIGKTHPCTFRRGEKGRPKVTIRNIHWFIVSIYIAALKNAGVSLSQNYFLGQL